MVDEFYDRGYQAARSDLNAAILDLAHRFGETLVNPFRVLNRIEYSAPWTIKSSKAPCN